MRHQDGRFTGAGGLELYRQEWLPDSEPSAVVVLVHGVGEHSGRYMNVVGPLVASGHAVYGYDHRGHGRSEGRRVHIDDWSEYREDLGTFLDLVARDTSGLPVVVYGHSMGSLVVLDYLLQSQDGLTGAIISGVALEPAGVSKPYLIALAKMLSGVTPTLAVSLGIEPESLTRDPEALAAYHADELIAPKATVRWGAQCLETVERIKAGMRGVELPILVVHGEEDPLNLPSGAHELYEVVPCADKTLNVYAGAHHEPHNDIGHEKVAADIAAWVSAHAATAEK